jgi:glycosyltransferase involved in cell wall biosynthesis
VKKLSFIKYKIIRILLSLIILVNYIYANVSVPKEQKVLLLYTGQGVKGGSRTYKINLYKYLKRENFPISFFLVNNPEIQEELKYFNLPFYLCVTSARDQTVKYYADILAALKNILDTEQISIINCNTPREVSLIKELRECSQKHPFSIVLTLHVDGLENSSCLKDIDGVIAVSPQIEQKIKKINKQKNLNIKTIDWCPPFFDAERFLKFKPEYSRKDFFKKNFNIDILDSPIICMIGNFLKNNWKDCPTLFNAIKKIIFDYKIPVQLILAGDGPLINQAERLVKNLKISEYVHFLGYTQLIPELLFHSDINVLVSHNEAFGIAILEAALMKKPIVGTKDTGMENVIKDKITGLLFEKEEANDLAQKIMLLLKNKKLCEYLENSVYLYVRENFMPEGSIKKIKNFYLKVGSHDKN